MNTSEPRADDLRRARRSFLLVGLVAPIIIAVAALILIVIWLPDLPAQIVTHWGPNGPDGYGSPAMYVWVQIFNGLGLPLLLTVPVLAMMRKSWGATARFLAALSLGLSAFISVGMAGSVAIQRNGGDGSGIGLVLAIGFTGMLVLGVLGWFVQPRVTIAGEATRTTPLHLAPGERAAWFGTAAMARPGAITLVVSVLLLIITTIWVFMVDAGAGWIIAAVTLVVIGLVATTLVFRVRANAEGLRIRSIAGWPRWSIPAEDITDVRVVQVNPMGEFGGWGLRLAVDGRMGIVLRTGEGIQITRRSGRRLVVTIDDAATAASVLDSASKGAQS